MMKIMSNGTLWCILHYLLCLFTGNELIFLTLRCWALYLLCLRNTYIYIYISYISHYCLMIVLWIQWRSCTKQEEVIAPSLLSSTSNEYEGQYGGMSAEHCHHINPPPSCFPNKTPNLKGHQRAQDQLSTKGVKLGLEEMV